jgi:uncharacterized lipoprotein NlpE involved in copper resistance
MRTLSPAFTRAPGRSSTSSRSVLALASLALLASAASLMGCDAKADKDDCTKMAEHDYGILDQRNQMSATEPGKKMLEELKAKTIEGCIGKKTKSQIECHMKAPTPADMSKCDKE